MDHNQETQMFYQMLITYLWIKMKINLEACLLNGIQTDKE